MTTENIRVVGDLKARDDIGNIVIMPQGKYEITINGLVFLKKDDLKYTLFLSNYQSEVKKGNVEYIVKGEN